MGKNKLVRFEEMKTFDRVFQPDFLKDGEFQFKGKWNTEVFKNSNPIVLELGCGRGEYTIGMGKRYPEKNFIGIDIKGARLWRGAKTSNEEKILNTAFIRTRIEFIEKFFAREEVNEIWITFPDPQPRTAKENKRLSSSTFLNRYRQFCGKNAIVHLKTDNYLLYEFTLETVRTEQLEILNFTSDLYHSPFTSSNLDLEIKTTYEQKFLDQGMKICYLCFKLFN